MSKKSYAELLRDPRWQRKRLEVMQRANFACEKCGDTTTTLNVHHKYYEPGRLPWEYPGDALQCLCEPCHEAEHKGGLNADQVDPLSVSALDPRERELLELLLYHADLIPAAIKNIPAEKLLTDLGRRLYDVACCGGDIPNHLSRAVAELHDRAKRKEPKALCSASERLQHVINAICGSEEQQAIQAIGEKLAALEEWQLDIEEERDLLKRVAELKRKQIEKRTE